MSSAVLQKEPVATGAQSDEDLLLRYRDTGDELAIEELIRRYKRELYNYLVRYLADRSLAEEAFQELWLRVHQKSHQFQGDRRLRPWLYSIATNLAVDLMRRKGRHRAVSLEWQPGEGDEGWKLVDILQEEMPTALEKMEAEERRLWLPRALGHLPPYLRDPVILVYFQGLKYSEAAEVLDIPLGTVKSRLHAALERLLAAWRSGMEERRGDCLRDPAANPAKVGETERAIGEPNVQGNFRAQVKAQLLRRLRRMLRGERIVNPPKSPGL